MTGLRTYLFPGRSAFTPLSPMPSSVTNGQIKKIRSCHKVITSPYVDGGWKGHRIGLSPLLQGSHSLNSSSNQPVLHECFMCCQYILGTFYLFNEHKSYSKNHLWQHVFLNFTIMINSIQTWKVQMPAKEGCLLLGHQGFSKTFLSLAISIDNSTTHRCKVRW